MDRKSSPGHCGRNGFSAEGTLAGLRRVLGPPGCRALAHLAGGRADGTWPKRLGELARPAVLILDDFAMRELTPAQADDLYELITERAGSSLILTSNRAPQDWYPLFPNPVVAESLLDSSSITATSSS
jgi:hypothetical protein